MSRRTSALPSVLPPPQQTPTLSAQWSSWWGRRCKGTRGDGGSGCDRGGVRVSVVADGEALVVVTMAEQVAVSVTIDVSDKGGIVVGSSATDRAAVTVAVNDAVGDVEWHTL